MHTLAHKWLGDGFVGVSDCPIQRKGVYAAIWSMKERFIAHIYIGHKKL